MRELLFALHVYILSPILWLFAIAIIAYVVMGWLFTAGVIQTHNPTPRQIYGFLHSVVDPLARPIRRYVKPIGNLDLSVLLLILIIQFANGYAIQRLISFVPF